MRYLSLFCSLLALTACAQLPPYQRNTFTTNTIEGAELHLNEDEIPELALEIPDYAKSLSAANAFSVQFYSGGNWYYQFNLLGGGGGTLNFYGPHTGSYHGVTASLGSGVTGGVGRLKDASGTETITLSGSDGKGTFNQLVLRSPQWTDTALTYSYSLLGPNAPSLVATTNDSPIQTLAMDNADIIYAQGHFPHNVATTNAAFPQFYFMPHVHWTPIGTLDATHSNVTWRIEYELASTNGLWNVRGTNTVTVGVSNNWTMRKTDLGAVTNTIPPGHDAGIRVRLMRPASAGQEYGNDHIVLFDGIEIQVPVGNQTLLGHP